MASREAVGPLRPAPIPADDVRSRYRRALLAGVGLAAVSTRATPPQHPALAWAASGAMALTGERDARPVVAPAALACCASAVTDVLAVLAPTDALAGIDGADLLGERAAIAGQQRNGRISVGGTCRLFRARDGWLALNLARSEDVGLLAAWLEAEPETNADPWSFVARELTSRECGALVSRGRLLGMAVADASADPDPDGWSKIVARGSAREHDLATPPLVVDLSALWAGPLCSHLLALAGARVVKIESHRRPDGARSGPAAFYDLLNAGKQSVALDFGSREGMRSLHALLERADIVVEASRPRALEQLGIDAAALVRRRPGLTWTSITGYGRSLPERDWIAFGDDAAVAAGLARATGAHDAPLFCADAVADPLTGLHAALASLASWQLGGGRLLDVCLRDVTAHVLRFAPMPGGHRVVGDADRWQVECGNERRAVAAPHARPATRKAAPLGADTDTVLTELGAAC
jgi:hypothetical protein